MHAIEEKWQRRWKERNSFVSKIDDREKKFIVPMFPYPSGEMHMGHVRNYFISDAIARWNRFMGFNVCHAIGWDSFGMPAETAAITRGEDPKIWTEGNIARMRSQMMRMGFSFDWSREIFTHKEEYWKREQEFFKKAYKEGIFYRKEGEVNWDPVDKTVVANEQVVDGKGWRSGAPIERRMMKQWYFKTTEFAEDMIAGFPFIEGKWPAIVVNPQRKFIKNGITNGDTIVPFSDWTVSRQRAWGTPIPFIHCKRCGTVPSEEIVKHPSNIRYDGKGNPIANVPDFVSTFCPTCGHPAERETDTADTFVQSSWYFIRYISDFIDGKGFDSKAMNYWFGKNGVDYYIGGPEHATSHMIFSRFFWRMFKRFGWIPQEMPNEPFDKVICQGMVKNMGKKMSKSEGNGVSPDAMVEKYGADVARMFVAFASPPEKDIEWSDSAIKGTSKFAHRMIANVNKIWTAGNEKASNEVYEKIEKMENRAKKCYSETFAFNTVVAAAMECMNHVETCNDKEAWSRAYEMMIMGMMPICPHICSEIIENVVQRDPSKAAISRVWNINNWES